MGFGVGFRVISQVRPIGFQQLNEVFGSLVAARGKGPGAGA
jgi:hypothetical protein